MPDLYRHSALHPHHAACGQSARGCDVFFACSSKVLLAKRTLRTFITFGSVFEKLTNLVQVFKAGQDEFMNCEIFENLKSARKQTTAWKEQYNTVRPHSSLGYRTPRDLSE
ncbi:transposase [Gimesia benthica]|uniref:Transposase n=1 Tax=Gimesia benthica TaxID=2608982 RepID=A0A6I6AGB0_9PLAN|nr:transposase [Gimesia benthica]